MGQITVFQPNFLESKFCFQFFHPEHFKWAITSCPMHYAMCQVFQNVLTEFPPDMIAQNKSKD